MIKLIAALTMIIDHFAAFFLDPHTIICQICRAIGRVSMPLFGYCIARGFYYSKKNNRIKKYAKNLLIFSLISQIPVCFIPYGLHGYWTFKDLYLNIGFTWLVSLTMLTLASYLEKSKEELEFKNKILIIVAILGLIISSYFIRIEYGLYGVLFPIVFYYLLFQTESPLLCFVSTILIYSLYIIKEGESFFEPNSQIISIFSVFIIFLLQKKDAIIRLPKKFFYCFYPTQFVVFGLIKYFFFMKK